MSLVALTRQAQQPSEGHAPLIILLHGYGSNEQDLFSLAPMLPPQFHVVSLRAPLTLSYGMYAWFELYGAAGTITSDLNGERKAADLVIEGLQEQIQRAQADPQRVFLLGFSQGAALSVLAALAAPVAIRGVLAFSGFSEPGVLPQNLDTSAKPSFFVAHGSYDTVVPIKRGREMVESLRMLDLPVSYQEYPTDHSIPAQALDAGMKWLVGQV